MSGFTPEIKIDPARLARAVYLDATPIDLATFRVTGGAKDHTVEVVDGGCRCDCFDHRITGDGCKHSLAVRLRGGDEEVIRALRQIVPKPQPKARV